MRESNPGKKTPARTLARTDKAVSSADEYVAAPDSRTTASTGVLLNELKSLRRETNAIAEELIRRHGGEFRIKIRNQLHKTGISDGTLVDDAYNETFSNIAIRIKSFHLQTEPEALAWIEAVRRTATIDVRGRELRWGGNQPANLGKPILLGERDLEDGRFEKEIDGVLSHVDQKTGKVRDRDKIIYAGLAVNAAGDLDDEEREALAAADVGERGKLKPPLVEAANHFWNVVKERRDKMRAPASDK